MIVTTEGIKDKGESAFIPGFRLLDVELGNGIRLRAAVGGQGEPLLMLHGHPQNHVTWRKIAPRLLNALPSSCPIFGDTVTAASRRATPSTAPIPSARWQRISFC